MVRSHHLWFCYYYYYYYSEQCSSLKMILRSEHVGRILNGLM